MRSRGVLSFLLTLLALLLLVAILSPAFLCLIFVLPLFSLSLSRSSSCPWRPISLTRLWLQDFCIQCVIIVPTLSSESLSDWLTDCSLRSTDPSVYYSVHSFMCTSSLFILSLFCQLLFVFCHSPFHAGSCSFLLFSLLHRFIFPACLLPRPSSVSLHHPCPLLV